MNNKESSKLKLNDIKEIMNDINDEVIGFYEGNSDKEDNLHGIPGFNSRDEFIRCKY